jgi:hypothetical protein
VPHTHRRRAPTFVLDDLWRAPTAPTGRRGSWEPPLSRIEIARAAHAGRNQEEIPIQEIGAKLGIPSEALLPFGHDKAKVGADFIGAWRTGPTAS